MRYFESKEEKTDANRDQLEYIATQVALFALEKLHK